MKRHKRGVFSLILLVFVVAFLLSCSMGIKKSFLVTQKTFNDMVEKYHAYYMVAPPDEQADLKKNVHPKIKEALNLLSGMNQAIRLGIDPSKIDQKKFRDLRYELYKKLPKIFKKEG